MKTITLKNINTRQGFARVADLATDISKDRRALVRFTMGPAGHRQTFVASPKKPLATLVWEWSKSAAGLAAERTKRKPRVVLPKAV